MSDEKGLSVKYDVRALVATSGKTFEDKLAELEKTNSKKFTEANIIRVHLERMKLGKPDITQLSVVKAEIAQFLVDCADTGTTPTITGVAMQLGLTRERLARMKRGEYDRNKSVPVDCQKEIAEVYATVEAVIEQGLLQGNSPAGFIFVLKNNFGWKDEQLRSIKTYNSDAEVFDVDKVKARYGKEPIDVEFTEVEEKK